MSNDRTEIMSVQEFRSKTMKPQLRPASWKWEEVYPKMMESLDESGAGSTGVSLVHKDLEGAGVSPSMNVIVQVFKPGEKDHAHRHSNVALFLVFEGEGYSMIDGEKIEWKKGDLVLAPAWSDHAHCNTSETENAILVTFQDVPQVSNLGAWFFEEPVGTKPLHVVGGEFKTELNE
ncbi:cupin domain-containing protein [Virgibacillus sp. W0181]|uniref:cupin domain-containing protein n=1 Tax=Virgibacillus sp. W0181 TaxID=3391581 RepID=UPI003F47B753